MHKQLIDDHESSTALCARVRSIACVHGASVTQQFVRVAKRVRTLAARPSTRTTVHLSLVTTSIAHARKVERTVRAYGYAFIGVCASVVDQTA
jgi:hypothetical protein